MRSHLGLGIAGALVITLGWAGAARVVPPVSAAPGSATSVVLTRASAVRWGSCPSDVADGLLRCASIAVPLNHARPHGSQIHLELSMLRHDPSAGRYLGRILVNPGGPGASGLLMAESAFGLPGSAARRFDWVGFDPRGVGHSRPTLVCRVPASPVPLPWYTPSTANRMHYWRREARQVAAGCGRGSGTELLNHLTTADNARDMESIRQALGARRINYYGASWGSFLGETYAELYPGHVNRMILDGVIDPTKNWYRINFDQDRSFQANFERFWAYMARHDATFHLGTAPSTVRRAFHAKIADLRRHPAYGGRVGPSDVIDVLTSVGYTVTWWPAIGRALSALIRRGAARPFFLGTRHGVGGGVYNAVECTDMRWPGWDKTRADSWKVDAAAPDMTWSNTWMNAPCLDWPARAHRRLHIGTFTRKVLLLSETYDAATPYSGALALRRLWPASRLVEGVRGTSHAVGLGGRSCTKWAIVHYLATRRLPARAPGDRSDQQCSPVPQPAPTAARTAARPVALRPWDLGR